MVSTHIYGVSKEIHGETFIFRVNLGMWPLKLISSGKTNPVLRVSTYIYGISQEIHGKRPTKWSGHGKMIDPRRNSTYERPFTWEGNYLVFIFVLLITTHSLAFEWHSKSIHISVLGLLRANGNIWYAEPEFFRVFYNRILLYLLVHKHSPITEWLYHIIFCNFIYAWYYRWH